jgi:hypothetical protein
MISCYAFANKSVTIRNLSGKKPLYFICELFLGILQTYYIFMSSDYLAYYLSKSETKFLLHFYFLK